MTKDKFLTFMPGDDVNINIHFKCSESTLIRISAITIDEFSLSDNKIDFDI